MRDFRRPQAPQPARYTTTPGWPKGILGRVAAPGNAVSILRAFFAPVNTVTPPLSRGTGNRIVQGKQANPNAPQAFDSATVQLTAGKVEWTFSVRFASAPSVTATPIGSPPSSGTTVFVADQTTVNGALIKSTDGSDVRQVFVQAFGAPG